MNQTRQITLSGFFVALSVLLPMVFHWVGAMGSVFLPMHIPVLLAGMLLGARSGFIVGVLSPGVSALITGMPPLWPILPVMTAELAIYAACAGYLYRSRGLSRWWALAGALLTGRLAALLTVFIMAETLRLPLSPVDYVLGAAVAGIPGVAIQFAALPLFIKRLERSIGRGKEQDVYGNG